MRTSKQNIFSSPVPLLPLSPTFAFDLQMNGSLFSDIVSRLPNDVSNYELCYFQCSEGCDWGKEGTRREEEVGGKREQ